MWRIAAGRSGRHAETFINHGFVSLGWHEIGDATQFRSREATLERAREVFPDQTERQLQVGSNQVWRFLNEIKNGDEVVVYQPSDRLYHIGKVTGPARYTPGDIEEMELARSVQWLGSKSRDALLQSSRNSLGAIQTLIKVPLSAERDLLGTIPISQPDDSPTDSHVELNDSSDPYAELTEQAVHRVQDRILSLDWSQLQDLVAALLRALGYRTIVSPAGADRGRDIIASRDGFGFERPRIVVEVKHRRERMGAPEIRSFVGGRHADDRGLYVSTGGFSQEAKYEADRAATVTHLMDLDGLARAVIEQYDHFHEAGRALLPLRRLYWPA